MSEYKKIIAERDWEIVDLTIENRLLKETLTEYESLFDDLESNIDRILAKED